MAVLSIQLPLVLGELVNVVTSLQPGRQMTDYIALLTAPGLRLATIHYRAFSHLDTSHYCPWWERGVHLGYGRNCSDVYWRKTWSFLTHTELES